MVRALSGVRSSHLSYRPNVQADIKFNKGRRTRIAPHRRFSMLHFHSTQTPVNATAAFGLGGLSGCRTLFISKGPEASIENSRQSIAAAVHHHRCAAILRHHH
jgi:hypothetical protein